MSRFVWIGKTKVSVSEEIYREYRKMIRREKYLEKEVKVGKITIDTENERVNFIDSKEDSIQRLSDLGEYFADEQLVEDVICDKATLLILQEAMAELNQEEQELVQSIYYQNQTTRKIAEQQNVSQPAIVKRQQKVLGKLKKYFL